MGKGKGSRELGNHNKILPQWFIPYYFVRYLQNIDLEYPIKLNFS
jgi:hypothetical protein